MTHDETCVKCFFFVPAPHAEFGWCKYNPPVLIGTKTVPTDTGSTRMIGMFNNPTTATDGFCSKWEAA